MRSSRASASAESRRSRSAPRRLRPRATFSAIAAVTSVHVYYAWELGAGIVKEITRNL